MSGIRERMPVAGTILMLLAAAAVAPRAQTIPILLPGGSIQLPNASIWGGISYNGEHICVTTTLFLGRPHLFLRKLDREMRPVGSPVQLTFDTDPESAKRITDHKHLYLNGFFYVVFSVAGDSDLYLFRTDTEGRRVGQIVPVVEGTADRTNDMMFCSDGERLFVAYFRPNEQSVVRIFDRELRQVRPPLVTSSALPHNNLGGMAYHEGRFYMYTGDKAGPNSNLILTVWNRDWTPAEASRRILIPAPAGGGYFFASGISFDSLTRRWYLGFHHVLNSDPDATTHLDLAVFDERFTLMEHQHTVSGFRPHFLLLEDSLYSVFDRGGVFLNRYLVRDRFSQAFDRGGNLDFPSVALGDRMATGMALVNTSAAAARLSIAAYDDRGALLAVPGGNNPAALTLAGNSQQARIFWQFFGTPFESNQGWIQISSDTSDVTGFQLISDSMRRSMDGAPAVHRPLTYFIVPETTDAEVSLVNPVAAGTADLLIRRFSDEGHEAGSPLRLSLGPRQKYAGPANQAGTGGYLLIQTSSPLAAGERFGRPGEFEAAMNALDANGGALRLYAPQYVRNESFRTVVTLINLEDAPTNLTLELRGDDGSMLGRPASAALPSRGGLRIGDPAIFGIPPTTAIEGFLTVLSDATRITGIVSFQDPEARRFSTALPLEAEGRLETWFAQVAEEDGYFTGLAVVNPGATPASATVSVHTQDGRLVRAGNLTIPGPGRAVKLLHQLVPGLPLANGGYFVLRSSVPVIAFGVFGTDSLQSLAAIPAQWAHRTSFEGAAPAEDYALVNPDSDFSPPRGGIAGGPGPAMFRLTIARSTDGLQFRRTGRIVCDQGAVPDLVADRQGTLYLYYTGWVVGNEINKTVVAISKNGGSSWTFRKLRLARNEGESDLVDPDVLILDNGTFRLYTTISDRGQYARSYWSDSADGIRFERKGIAFDPGSQALDPSAIRIGNSYHIFAGGVAGDPEANWHGVSDDAAQYRFDRTMTFRVNGSGQMMANGLAVDGGYRFYCFGNDRRGGISSVFTTDGVTWTPDAGYRLSIDPESRLEDGQPTDPAVARLPDGTYLMVYSCKIRK